MTDDLVKRLRKRTDPFKMVTTVPIQESPDWICQEAADCIEKFDAALVRTFDKMMEDGKRIEKLEAALNCNLPDYDPKIGIVERLRQLGNWRVDGTKSSPIYNKSADHIEKLEAALLDLSDGYECCPVSQEMRQIARKALEKKDD